jgi:hypothetical protein
MIALLPAASGLPLFELSFATGLAQRFSRWHRRRYRGRVGSGRGRVRTCVLRRFIREHLIGLFAPTAQGRSFLHRHAILRGCGVGSSRLLTAQFRRSANLALLFFACHLNLPPFIESSLKL